jgi:alcohol dehydrogenase (cytochrome c)
MRSGLFLCFLTVAIAAGQTPAPNQAASPGQRQFDNNCSVCHGGDGNGGELGPAIAYRIQNRSDAELAELIHTGIPSRGMPAFNLGATETDSLVAFLRTLRPQRRGFTSSRKKVETVDGATLDGMVIGESSRDLALRTDDSKIHLLRPAGNNRYRAATNEAEWPTYNGQVNGNRYTTLSQIAPTNVARLAPHWIFTLPNVNVLETTPVVVGGFMFVTSGNECYALDAGTGRQLWHFQRPRTRGLTGNAAGGFNRGVAVAGDRVFMVTDNAHLLALNRNTGAMLWDTEMADWHQNYNATSAPLVVDNLVVSGTAGGEQGVRGFLAAFDQATGKEAWRFWTVPAPGEPGSETWEGKDILHGSSVTWLTGSYDPELDTIYWPTGNPGPDYNDDQRGGDNLYSCSMLALDAKTGKLKWYYQFTPHDIWDWDATETPVLIDANWHGQSRKLLIQANRNGFFYVLDRVTGKVLSGTPFVENLNWATGIGKDGRPLVNNLRSDPKGTEVCPAQDGATNWYSPSYNPALGLYFVQSLEACSIVTKRPVEWQAGRGFMGGNSRIAPDKPHFKVLRAIDIQTGKIVWELPEVGRGDSWGGTLATATGLVFLCDDGGIFTAVDAAHGKPLWEFQTNQFWRASPMTYMADGKQFVAVAAGQNIIAFSLLN